MKLFINIFAIVSVIGGSNIANAMPKKDFSPFTLEQKQEDFAWITSQIEEYYAPLQYKEERFGFNWETLKSDTWNKIAASGNNKNVFASLIQEMVAQFGDAHTSAYTNRDYFLNEPIIGTLGFFGHREKENFVVDATDAMIYGVWSKAPIQAGDIIVAYNGKSLIEAAQEEILRYRNLGQAESNKTLGIHYLFERMSWSFPLLPSGTAELTVQRAGQELKINMPWFKVSLVDIYTSYLTAKVGAQKLAQVRRLKEIRADGKAIVEISKAPKNSADLLKALNEIPSFMRGKYFGQSDVLLSQKMGTTQLTTESTKLPSIKLGVLDFELLQTSKGLAAIYRIEDFMWSRIMCDENKAVDLGGGFSIVVCDVITAGLYAQAFDQLKNFGVNHLILDLRNNGGGYLDFGYELVKALTKSSFALNKAEIRLNEEWVREFSFLAALPGLPLSVKAKYQAINQTLQADIAEGKRISSPISIMGDETMEGVSNAWAGKTTVLVNEMCASMCDIFATLAQDLGIATIAGTQTMGAGGNVIPSWGISPRTKMDLTMTASKMLRLDGTPIENNGAKPDLLIEEVNTPDVWKKITAAIDAE